MSKASPSQKKERIDLGIAAVVTLLFLAFVIMQALPASQNDQRGSIVHQLASPVTAVADRDAILVDGVTFAPLPLDAHDRKIIAPEPLQRRTIAVQSTQPSMWSRTPKAAHTQNHTPIESNKDTLGAMGTGTPVRRPIDTTYDFNQSPSSLTEDTIKKTQITEKPNTSSDIGSPQTTIEPKNTTATEEATSLETASRKATKPAKSASTTTTTTDRSDRGCMIVIGAFANSSNIKKLVQQLEADGYDSFTTPHQGLTRVGVYSSCDNTILYGKLQAISSKYSEDAFALKRSR